MHFQHCWMLLNGRECVFAIKLKADSDRSPLQTGDLASAWLAVRRKRNVAEVWQVSELQDSFLVSGVSHKRKVPGQFV